MAGRTCPIPLVAGFNRPGLDKLENAQDACTPRMLWICSILAADLNGPAVVAQSTVLTFVVDGAGTANVDGTLRLTFAGGNLDAPVVVDVPVVIGNTGTNIAAAAETAIDGEGDLAGTVDATADVGAALTIDYEIGIGRVSVSYEWIPTFERWVVEAAGDYAAGSYVVTFEHASLGGVVTVPTPGNTDIPTTVADVEASIEGTQALFGIVASADDNGADAVVILTESGITDIEIDASGPEDAQWQVLAGTTVVSVTQAETVTLDLLTLQSGDQIPEQVLRLKHPRVYRRTAFPAGVTMDAGDDDTDAVLAGVALDDTGTIGDSGTAEGDSTFLEESWSPTATFHFATLPTTGAVDLEISYMVTPTPRTAA
jgi:hypothetical protein